MRMPQQNFMHNLSKVAGVHLTTLLAHDFRRNEVKIKVHK